MDHNNLTIYLLFTHLLGLLLCAGELDASQPRNCPEAFANGSPGNGEKTLYTNTGKKFKYYCYFNTYGHSYGFLHTDAMKSNSSLDLDIDLLRDDKTRALLLLSLKEQQSSWKQGLFRLLSSQNGSPAIMRNAYAGYKEPTPTHNPNNYLYIGFHKRSVAVSLDTQGVNVDGKDCTFDYCAGNPSSYIVLYPNQGGASPLDSPTSQLLKCIFSQLRTSPIRLPNVGYRMYGQFSFGGCGAARTTDRLNNFNGMALGFQHSYTTCGDPGIPANSQRTGTNFNFEGVVTYECKPEAVLMGGATSRTCKKVSGWSGSPIICGQSIFQASQGNWRD